jgi:hypothetical protein
VYLSLLAIWASNQYSPVIDGLIKAPNLHTISSSAFYDDLALRKLAENASLKVIHLKSTHPISDTLANSLVRDPIVKELVVIDPVCSSVRFMHVSYMLSC